MKLLYTIVFTFFLFAFVTVINSASYNITGEKDFYEAEIITATDTEYPDNNSIGFRSSFSGQYSHNAIKFFPDQLQHYKIIITPGNAVSDSVIISDVNLHEFIPSIPDFVKGDNYLTYLSLLNQEWNRIQVKFSSKQFHVKGNGTEKNIITRIDIANNCLAKGKWEIIAFTTENEKELLYFQCWFEFPEDLYDKLFLERNNISIAPYDEMLKNYGNEASATVNLSTLRLAGKTEQINFTNHNNELYPLIGERQTKEKNIVYPDFFTSINDFLTDETTYATFCSPGMYRKNDPRKTELSRFQKLNDLQIRNVTSSNSLNSKGFEIELIFSDNASNKITRFIIGGLQLDKIPVLNMQSHNKGFQRPIGIANHSFYNSYDDIIKNSSKENPYYAFLLEVNGDWLDSHNIGIDGPLLFKDEQDPNIIHLMILSFERHSFVGHYTFSIPENIIVN